MSNQQDAVLTPAENVRDAWRRLTLEPLRGANDPRYVDCSAARGANVAGKLQSSLELHSMDNHYMHLLLTGYRGDGKTTELFQFIHLIQDSYRPLYFDAAVEFELIDFRFPDFLLGIAWAIFERMHEHKLALPDMLVKDVADWFAKTLEVVERRSSAEIMAEGGVGTPSWFPWVTARLLGTLKASAAKRREVRRELNQNLTQLIDKIDKLLSEAVKVSRDSDGKELVIIFDSLDRLHTELAFDLFHTNGRSLRELDCHFVYVIPISLCYQPQAPLLPFDDIIQMPMIPIRDRGDQPNEANIALLRKLLEHRFVPDEIMVDPQQTLRDLILSSGGHLRDLVRVFRQACSDALAEPGNKINQRVAQRAINTLCETYHRAVVADDYAALIETHKNKAAENNERTQRLMFSTVVLAYDDNGVTWQDVHPALANGERFQQLLKKG
jgi:hypothetical protein